MGVRFLDQEDPLEKELATHFTIPAWRIPWGHRVRHNSVTNTFITFFSYFKDLFLLC